MRNSKGIEIPPNGSPVVAKTPAGRRWFQSRRWRSLLAMIFGSFVLLNVWTFRHAWTMTHFSASGSLTIRPEEMSVLGKMGVLLAGVNIPRPVNDSTPADFDQAIHAALTGEKQLKIFPEVGHEACFRARPDLWEECVSRFLDRYLVRAGTMSGE